MTVCRNSAASDNDQGSYFGELTQDHNRGAQNFSVAFEQFAIEVRVKIFLGASRGRSSDPDQTADAADRKTLGSRTATTRSSHHYP
jgi:hypothetical protein